MNNQVKEEAVYREVSVVDRFQVSEYDQNAVENLMVTAVDIPKGRNKTIDVGAWCYLKAEKRKQNSVCRPVVLDSLDTKRKPIVYSLIARISKKGAWQTLKTRCDRYSHVFDYLAEYHPDTDISNETVGSKIYIEYTAYLRQPKYIKLKTYSHVQQSAMADVLSEYTGISKDRIQRFAGTIPLNKNKGTLAPDSEKHKTNNQALLAIFNAVYEAIIENKHAFPYPVRYADQTHYYIGIRKSPDLATAMIRYIADSGLSKDDINTESLREFGIKNGFYKPGDRTLNDLFHSTIISVGNRFVEYSDRSNYRVSFASLGAKIFLQLFIQNTGCNLSDVLPCVTDEDMLNIIPSAEKGKRAVQIKNRANDNKHAFSFGLGFVETYKRYLKLREWIVNDEECNNFIVYRNHHTKQLTSDGVVYDNLVKGLERAVERILSLRIEIYKTRKARAHVSNVAHEATGGDVIAVAKKLGNTPNTVSSSYSNIPLEQSAIELTQFYDSMYDALYKNIKVEGFNAPAVIVSSDDTANRIPAGSCESDTPNPVLSEAFNKNAPAPNCGSPEGCLYCKFYVLHADEKDMLKLYSMRFYYQQLEGIGRNHDHYLKVAAPVLGRVDELLADIREQRPDLRTVMDTAEEEVYEWENLDSFWQRRLEYLKKIGIKPLLDEEEDVL